MRLERAINRDYPDDFHCVQSSELVRTLVSLHSDANSPPVTIKSLGGKVDCFGRRIEIGDDVRVAKRMLRRSFHREYRKPCREVAGRLTVIVGWYAAGGAWIPLRRDGVLTVETRFLRLVRRWVKRGR